MKRKLYAAELLEAEKAMRCGDFSKADTIFRECEVDVMNFTYDQVEGKLEQMCSICRVRHGGEIEHVRE